MKWRGTALKPAQRMKWCGVGAKARPKGRRYMLMVV